ncbi:MAG: carboxypeptidase regulatory-like domain-containing protein [Pyrinomonadaceae bacterium]
MKVTLFAGRYRVALSLFSLCLAAGLFLKLSGSVASQDMLTAVAKPEVRRENGTPISGTAVFAGESSTAQSLPLWQPEALAANDLGLSRKQLKAKRNTIFESPVINKNNRKVIRSSSRFGGADATQLFIDEALPPPARANAPDATMPPPVLTFDSPNSGGGVVPPDTTGDVGLTQFVQQTNAGAGTPFTVFNKTTGAVISGPTLMEALWPANDPCGANGFTSGDPVVLYDSLADRWLLSQFTDPPASPFYQCIAISRTSDAAGAYFIYTFSTPGSNFQDYPHYGVWPNGYYMAANQFLGNTFNGVGLFAFDRVKMLAGDPSAGYIYFNKDDGCPTCEFGGFLPTDFDGVIAPPAGMPNLFMTFNADEFGATDRVDGFLFEPNFANPASSTITLTANVPLAAFDGRSPNTRQAIEQMDGQNLDAIGDRLMHRLAYRNLGTQAAPVNAFIGNFIVNVSGVNPTTAATYQAAPRWFELRGTDSLAGPTGLTVYDQGTHAPDAGNGSTGLNRWMSSLAQDHNGRIAVGFSSSSTTQRANITWAGRDTGSPTGALNATEVTFYAAPGAQTSASGRWGDYSQMSVDPVDDCTFYYTQEVYNVISNSQWDSRIGYAKFPACSPVAKGTVTGTITSCSTGQPINGATISAIGGFSRLTSVPGTYSLIAGPGTFIISAVAPGFSSASQRNVVVRDGATATSNLCLTAVPILNAGVASIIAENCSPANGAVDPGETVTVALPVTNTGQANTVNDVGTLQATGGVTNPGGAQNYGVITAGGPAVTRNFTFTAASSLACGTNITATVAHVDNAANLGSLVYVIPTGARTNILTENFDSVTPPALPAGWTATNAIGPAPLWVAATGANDTPPNVAFVDSPPVIADKRLDSPAFTPTVGSQVTFRHSWDLEDTFDGGVLEISVAGAAFQDIIAAGGSFVTGGYSGSIAVGSGSPIGGRNAWTGTQTAFVTTTVNLPTSAAGQNAILRWRMATDESVNESGWRVDTVSITGRTCCLGGGPTPSPTATPPATPIPTPSPTPACGTERIADGGFEANTGSPVTNPNWTSTSTFFGTSLCTLASCTSGDGSAPPRTGNGWVWFDGTGTPAAESGSASQTVFIPNGLASLQYYLRIGSVTAPATSVLTVRVDGNVVQTITEPPTGSPAYAVRTVNLNAYANGANHVISFVYERPGGTTGSDNFTIDDVSLNSTCTAAIGGQVTTPFGGGLRSTVTVIDPQGVRRNVLTNSFGFYTFPNLPTGVTYVVRPISSRYRFASQNILLTGDNQSVNFVGLE